MANKKKILCLPMMHKIMACIFQVCFKTLGPGVSVSNTFVFDFVFDSIMHLILANVSMMRLIFQEKFKNWS